MDKTLGQIAHEAGEKYGGWARKWGQMHPGQKAEWEAIAQAVATAVKEEDARICEEICDRKSIQAAHIDDDEEERAFVAGVSCGAEDCSDAIRASIKEVK